MLNNCTIMGRLTHDPELKTTPSGTNVCSFSIACERDYAGQGEEKKTDFIDIVAWRGTAEFVSKYFTKGRMIIVNGSLEIRTWKDKNDNNRKTAEIIAKSVWFGDSKKSDDNGNAHNSGQYSPQGQPAFPASDYGGVNDDFEELGADDDLPF